MSCKNMWHKKACWLVYLHILNIHLDFVDLRYKHTKMVFLCQPLICQFYAECFFKIVIHLWLSNFLYKYFLLHNYNFTTTLAKVSDWLQCVMTNLVLSSPKKKVNIKKIIEEVSSWVIIQKHYLYIWFLQ